MHHKKNTILKYVDQIKNEDLTKRASSDGSNLQPPASQIYAKQCLEIRGFDNAIGVVIVLNLVVMIIEIDRGAHPDHEDDDSPLWITLCSLLALFIFIVELALRMLAFRQKFWMDRWNVGDFIIVTADTILTMISIVAAEIFPISILRIFRLSKLARVTKVLRVFPELRLLLAGLLSSLSTIFWGCVLLVFFLIVWSMLAVVFIHPLNKKVDYPDDCDRCYRAYSSTFQAALTFWQQIVTGDSWGQVTIPVMEQYPGTTMFFIPLFVCVGMAVMNLMLGVVVSVAQQAKDEMKEELEAEMALQHVEMGSHLVQLCRDMDVDGSGELSHDEVRAGMDQPGEFHDVLEHLGIGKDEFEVCWATLDADASGSVSYKELITYLCKMTTSDTQFMLAYIKYYISTIMSMLTKIHGKELQMEQLFEEELLDEVAASTTMPLVGETELILEKEDEILNDLRKASESQTIPQPSNVFIDGKNKGATSGDTPKRSASSRSSQRHRQSRASALGGVTLATLQNDMETRLGRVCEDIAALRVDLKDVLTEAKFGKRADSFSTANYGNEMPLPRSRQFGNFNSCVPACCESTPMDHNSRTVVVDPPPDCERIGLQTIFREPEKSVSVNV